MIKTRYKFLNLEDNKVKSNSGNCEWKLNEWKHEDEVSLCNKGFHCSKEIWEAFSYVQGSILAEVEVKGSKEVEDSKEVYSDMRIVKMWKWQKKDSVALSIYSAELCINEFEKLYPDDKRPREAIEAAKKWILEPTEANQSAARSAWSAALSAESAARSARSAWSAALSAESAARSAWSAALSAESAAWSAARSAAWSAWSAESAARSAWSAALSAESAAWSAAWSAESAARKKVFTKICKWFDERLNQLETYE